MLVITTNYPEKLDKALIIRVPGAARHHELRLGIGVEWTPVYRGFLVTLAWITALLAVSTIVLKIRR